MKLNNIIKNLQKEGYVVETGEFSFQECKMVSGTALIDLVDDAVVETSAKYKDVVEQITEGKSHVYTIVCGKKKLSQYDKR